MDTNEATYKEPIEDLRYCETSLERLHAVGRCLGAYGSSEGMLTAYLQNKLHRTSDGQPKNVDEIHLDLYSMVPTRTIRRVIARSFPTIRAELKAMEV